MVMKGRRRRRYQMDFIGHGGDNSVMFSIPYPAAPADLSPSESTDKRRLGIGFVNMTIKSYPTDLQDTSQIQ
jgi:hypothetical protein